MIAYPWFAGKGYSIKMRMVGAGRGHGGDTTYCPFGKK